MKEIQLNKHTKLSKYYMKYVALVSDRDFAFLNKFNWSAKPHGKTFYARCVNPDKNGSNMLYMHRLILGLTDPKIEVDHKDHNGLNNQRRNFRITKRIFNCRNRRKYKAGTSIYKGVTINSGAFVARITANQIVYNLGRFDNERDAAIAYNKGAITHHGEYAHLNKILPKSQSL